MTNVASTAPAGKVYPDAASAIDGVVADGQTLRQTLALGEQAQLGLEHAHLGRVAGAFLADNDAALGINGVRRHQGRRHHLAQDVQALRLEPVELAVDGAFVHERP